MSGKIPEWNHWKTLTHEQQSYEKHRLLQELYEMVEKQHTTCCTQINSCGERLKRHRTEIDDLKNTNNRIKWIASGIGLGGGFGGVGLWTFIKDLFK